MGLILPQTVKIRPYGKNYYMLQEKGYLLPMKKASQGNRMVVDRSKSIEIDVLDLLPMSNEKIYYTCDLCQKIVKATFSGYMRSTNNNTENSYCQKCSVKVKNSGENNYLWDKNITDEERKQRRMYPEYFIFLRNVLARDNNTCQCCGLHGNKMQVHHLNGYNWDIEHRLDVKNGITLCKKCHENFHVVYGRGNNTKEQFEEWLGYRLQLTDYNEITSTPKIICLETGEIFFNIAEAAEKEGLSYNSVYYSCCGRSNVCRANGRHYEYYERYIHLSQDEIQSKLNNQGNYRMHKPIICLTTGELFNNVKEACKKYNIKDAANIYSSIDKHERYGHSGNINGIGLDWMFLEIFNTSSLNIKKEIYSKNKATILKDSFLYNLFN